MELDEFGRAIVVKSLEGNKSNNNKRSRCRGNNSEDDYDDDTKDRTRSNNNNRNKKKKKKREWPPCFDETHGSDYILDVRSGMFYQAESDFFYDPQTKLYYGNKQAAYFRYNKDCDPPKFVEISNSSNNNNTKSSTSSSSSLLLSTSGKELDALLLDTSTLGANNKTSNKQPSISITLKTKN